MWDVGMLAAADWPAEFVCLVADVAAGHVGLLVGRAARRRGHGAVGPRT